MAEFFKRIANKGIRTPDLLITNQLLYQLSYVGACLLLPFWAQDLEYYAPRPGDGKGIF
jgi:hypothetical protein